MTQIHPDDDLVPFMTGRLDEADRRRVEEHLAQCPRCRKEVKLLEAIAQEVQNEHFPPPPLDLGWRQLRRQLPPRPARQTSQWLRPAMAAGIALLILQGGIIAWQYQNLRQQSIAPMGEMRSGMGEARWIVLPAPGARMTEITRFLQENELHIVSGPSALGRYHIAPSSTEARDPSHIGAILRAHPELFAHVEATDR